LEPAELRGLLERQHAISEALSAAESRVSRYGAQIARATKRHAELVNSLVAATARRDEALQVVDDHDHPLRRRRHRSELGQAHATLRQAGLDIERLSKELAETERRLSDQRSSIRQAEETLQDRPALDREAHAIGHALQRDLAARRAAIAADPPERFVDWLGPRPARGSADLWDDAAAHIDQHRCAFGITNERNALGSSVRTRERSALADSQRGVTNACDRLDRTIGRGPVLERGLELGIDL
jgi:chromosome segregation ATPase